MTLFAVRFVVAFTAASFVVSLLSWSRSAGGYIPNVGTSVLIHMVVHAVFGAVAALPTRRPGPILAMATCSMLIDIDHLAYFLGWPVPTRGSHSLLFLVVGPTLMAAMARAGLFGKGASPRLAAGMAFSATLAHLAWDAFTGSEARAPLWLPFSTVPFALSATLGSMLEIVAVAVMWLTTLSEGRRSRPRVSRSSPLQS